MVAFYSYLTNYKLVEAPYNVKQPIENTSKFEINPF